MGNSIADAVIGVVGKGLDRFIPDPVKQKEFEIEIMRLEQEGAFKGIEAIKTEAQSDDPWTSRARPSFMYVMYALLLWSIPMGFLSAFNPEFAIRVIDGFKLTLAAIPESLYALFGVGYLGYNAARSYDKKLMVQGGGR